MPTVTYIEPNGAEREITVEAGKTVMQGAIDNMVDGILAECGGSCSCATCHCYVGEAWLDKTGEVSEAEEDMLDCVTERKENSRLGCQIKVGDEHEGLVIKMPDSQF
jgi:2Fe-2S ferredoxin|tara:strand:+ start:17069 stop:17389 length:321 start_codon:yes stop_codon:yes gene_type:complete